MINKFIHLPSEMQILSEYTSYTNSSMLFLILRTVKSSVLQANFYTLLWVYWFISTMCLAGSKWGDNNYATAIKI